MPRLRLREVRTFLVASIIGFGIAGLVSVAWSWSGWPVVGALATLAAVVAAGITIYYARQSVQAARDTIKPLQDMATDLDTAAKALQTSLRIAERTRQEQQYERIHAGLIRMRVAAYGNEAREGQAVLRAALAPFSSDKLPATWAVAETIEPGSTLVERVDKALAEVHPLMDNARKELDDLLKSAGAKPQPDGAANANPG